MASVVPKIKIPGTKAIPFIVGACAMFAVQTTWQRYVTGKGTWMEPAEFFQWWFNAVVWVARHLNDVWKQAFGREPAAPTTTTVAA